MGAAAPVRPKPAVDTTARLLQVGKKRRATDGDDDDEHIPENEDEEDELGRSGIATEAPKETRVEDEDKPKKKKKKKAGKKERQKQKEQSQDFPGEDVPESQTADKDPPGGDQEDPAQPSAGDDNLPSESNERKPKRKRRKVRSRQKNIYKDNRSAEERPDYLVPGGYEYRGRPMTSATRAKMQGKQLVPAEDAFRANWDTTDQEMMDNGVPVLSSAKELEDKSSSAGAARKGKAKKKKSKYKNMQ